MVTARVASVYAQPQQPLVIGLAYNAKTACLGIPDQPVSRSAMGAFVTPVAAMVSVTKDS